jgi:abortive infection bacteriophage resistance protein
MFIYGRRIGEVDIYVIPIIAEYAENRIDADRLFFPFSIIFYSTPRTWADSIDEI